MSSRIEDYALIGNCNAAALVASDGSIDWLCWPRFDSDACFAALLGTNTHGRWLIAPYGAPPGGEARVTRRYRPNTLILETRFETRDGAVCLVDFMPMRGTHSSVVRLVIGERGQVAMHTELILRFGYGAVVPWMERLEDGTLRAIAGPDMAVLRTPVAMVGRDMTHVGEFTVAAGEHVPFVLAYGPSHMPPPSQSTPRRRLPQPKRFGTNGPRSVGPPAHGRRPSCVRRSP
jgi:GH15 family glucan-1,4-alpha-glucosidase